VGVSQTSTSFPNPAVITQLHEFQNGTWIENIAVRPSGQLLLTLFDRPEVYTLDPKVPGAKPELVHKFQENATKLLGITEYATDKYAVVVGSSENGKDAWSIWSLDVGAVKGANAQRRIRAIPGAEMLNGLTTLDGNTVLAADTTGGVVYCIDLLSGEHSVVLNDKTMMPGINGVRYRAPYLYYTNTVQGLFARVQIHPRTARSAGPVKVIATKIEGVDDFALPSWAEGDAYIANFFDNTVLRVQLDGNVTVFAKGISVPTSASFGRTDADARTLYVVTSVPPASGGGRVVALKV
jgi:outer membrane protein assembly factor BamB